MSLKAIPVDQGKMRFAVVDVVPVAAFAADGSRSGEQRMTDDGVPLWRVNVLAIIDGVPGGETVPVRVAAEVCPVLDQLAPVRFVGLVARPWEQNGRSGVSLSADGIESATSPRGARNGHVDKPEQVAA